MDPDVSNPELFGYSYNASIMEDPSTYKTNITLETCQKMYQNETRQLHKSYPNGFCNVSFDNILCWPPTPYDTNATIKCFSEFMGIPYDDTKNVTRRCYLNGTWSKSLYDGCPALDMFPPTVDTQSSIYLIGYLISSVTLAIAIFIFTYFKELRCLRNKIHMNLFWSYLLTYCMWIIILIELNFRVHMAVTCVFLVTLLHYFHITTFFWMFVEGLYLYILVVRTLTRESFKLRVYVLIGWGLPLLFVIVWAVIKSILMQGSLDDQSDGLQCVWFNASNIDYIFQVPTISVLVVNIAFMVSIMIVLVTKLRSANTLEIQQYRKAVKALAVLIPLLGVTYAITIYAPWLSIWDMLRSALLSVQGFMVALFYCFLNTEVQNTLKHHFETWKTKKSLGNNRLRSSSRKDGSPRSRTESLRNTEWTLVGAEDLEDNRRMSHIKAKDAFLTNRRRESDSGQPLLNQQKLGSEPKYPALTANNLNPPPLLVQRKESLVNQPLFEQSEDSSPEDLQSSYAAKDVIMMLDHKGNPVTIPVNLSSASLRA